MDHDRAQRVAELLVGNIHDELASASALNNLDLEDAVLQRLAEAVAANVLYAFTVDWSPDWIKAGQAHTWQSSDGWYARCTVCLADSPPVSSRDAAIRWATDHATSHSLTS